MISVSYNAPSAEKIKQLNGTYWHQHDLPHKCYVQKLISKNIYKYLNKSVNTETKEEGKKFVTMYTMSNATDRPRPHIDLNVGEYNCLIYICGDEKINNGTGFYVNDGKGDRLNTHIGFKENRALLFNSGYTHAPLQWAGDSSWRYSIVNFFALNKGKTK